jgi:hypothetical protein
MKAGIKLNYYFLNVVRWFSNFLIIDGFHTVIKCELFYLYENTNYITKNPSIVTLFRGHETAILTLKTQRESRL